MLQSMGSQTVRRPGRSRLRECGRRAWRLAGLDESGLGVRGPRGSLRVSWRGQGPEPAGAWPGLGTRPAAVSPSASRPQGTQHRQTPGPLLPTWDRELGVLAPGAGRLSSTSAGPSPLAPGENGPLGFLLLLLPQASCLEVSRGCCWALCGHRISTPSSSGFTSNCLQVRSGLTTPMKILAQQPSRPRV